VTDAHCHVDVPGATRRFVCPLDDAVPAPTGTGDVVFWGVHPWYLDGTRTVDDLRAKLLADPRAGVGEIGLDRLRDRTISPQMREVFEAQLRLAAEFHRPVILHGAKCWGEVVATVRRVWGALHLSSSPSLLFHGFSRSDGLISDIVGLGGYISVGPAVLNDHAVNYRALVKKIPTERLLVETDVTVDTAATCPPLADIASKVAELRGVPVDALAVSLEANADAFVSCPVSPILSGGGEV